MNTPFFIGRRALLKAGVAAAVVSGIGARRTCAQPPAVQAQPMIYSERSATMLSQTLDYQGARLHYQTGGQAQAPVLVLLHGGLGSIDDFSPLLPRLQERFCVIAVDTRGHGRSTFGDAALTYAQAADDVRCILRRLGVGAYSLFGFSDGGTTAYRLGAEDENVQKIITLGADWHKDHLAGNRPMFEAIDAKFLKENLPDQLAAYQACNPAPDVDKMAASLKAMWLDECSSGYPNEAMRKIKAPVLAIRGEADFLYAFADWAALAGELPDVHLMNVPFAAHEAMKEQPEMVWAAVKAFFQVA